MLEDWTLRLRSLFRPRAVERELDAELQFHLEEQIASYMRQGLVREEAARRARLEFGGLDQIKEEHRDVRGVRLVEDLGRDVRYALRQLRRSPGFAAAAILCLGLGIGAATTITSIVNTVLLQPLPFTDSDRLVRVIERFPTTAPGRPIMERGITQQEFLDWREHARTLSDAVAILGPWQQRIRSRYGTAALWSAAMSPHTFTMLGVRAIVGRTFDTSDAAWPAVVVLTYDTWRRHFNADPNVVGTVILVGGPTDTAPLTVIGVLPPEFEWPTDHADYYTPIAPPTSRRARETLSFLVTMVGRLAAGVSLTAASDELNAMGAAIRPPWPADAPALAGPRFELQRLKDLAVGELKPALRILLAAVAVVLFIVCANVAHLLLARGTARRREIETRLAIGASRGRIARQILTECGILAAVGGTLGAVLAAAGVTLVKRLAVMDAPGIFRLMFGSTMLPRAHEVSVDLRMLAIAFGIAAATSVLFGVLPALHMARTRHTGTRSPVRPSGAIASRTRAALVVGQLGMATVLLIGAGLVVQSFVRLVTNDKGYDPSNVVALQLLFPNEYSTARRAQAIDTFLTRLRQLPGVQAAGFARHGVLIGEWLTIGSFVPPGRTLADMRNDAVRPRVRSVSDGFLTAMGVPLLSGRDFDSGDVETAPLGIVINRSAARRYFGSTNAVGLVVDWHVGEPAVQMTVIGVVEDIRQESLAQETFPEVYVHYRQFLSLLEGWPQYTRRQNEWAIGFLSFAIRTGGDPAAAIGGIRQLVAAVDPNVSIDAVVPAARLVASSIARERFSAVLIGVFATVAAVLAAIGVYGLLAYLVAHRTQEIGIRMALGAQRSEVLALVLRKGLILTTIGITIGVVSAAAVTRFLEGMLFGVTPLDPSTFLAVVLMFGIVTMFASYVPARRATRVDPLVALRSE